MTVRTVGILSPGEMGSSIGYVLQQHGARAVTCLSGRGESSRERAQQSNIQDLPDLEALVDQADVILSIVPPAVAGSVADQVATAIRTRHADVLYADCNAVAPSTVRGIAQTITDAGARFSDAGMIGPPATRPGNRIFASGPGAEDLAQLRDFGLDIRVLPGEVGQASGLKMCYAALTKGLQALGAELLVAAQLMGVDDALRQEQSQGDIAQIRAYIERALPSMLPKAYRWIGEMEEIARTFEDLGIPGRLLLGAADVYRDVRDEGKLRTELRITSPAR